MSHDRKPSQPQPEQQPLKGGKPAEPVDDAQRQDEPEKLHGDPVRVPGGSRKGQ